MTSANPTLETLRWLGKWLVYLALGLSGLLVIGAGLVMGFNWYSHQRHVDRLELVIRSPAMWGQGENTGIEKKQDTPCTSAEHPIFVGVLNRSGRTLEWINIEIKARFKGHSSNILPPRTFAPSDQIIKPGGGAGLCWSFPVSDANTNDTRLPDAIWSGEIVEARFQ